MQARQTLLTVASFYLGLLPGCGGGGGGGGAGDTGQVQITLADSPSDEIERFEVDVRQINLVKRNGARVSTLPLTTRVDFAELVEVAELINAASVPLGVYTRAEVILDFSGAQVRLAGQDADASLLDEDGQPLAGRLALTIQLEDDHPLVVAPGLPRILTIDFDLDASTTVDAAANSVTVLPVFVADLDLERPRIHRIRGPLESVDAESGSFVVAVRPFRALRTRYGSVRVSTDAATHFEIDGACYQGEAGIRKMAELPFLTAVIAEGKFQPGGGRFLAEEVLAGTSVPGGGLDIVKGLVTARAGNSLTLLGAQLDRAAGSVTFNAFVTLELDPASTRVTKQFSMDPQSTDAVSVGQRIIAFGDITGVPGAHVMDSPRRVRLLRTKVSGLVKSAFGGRIVVDLQRIGHRLPGIFDFSGTGPAGSKADPDSYEIDTDGLDLPGVGAGTPARVFGFAAPFGTAPPDFEARTVVDVSEVNARLIVIWRLDSDSQLTAADSRLDLDLADSPLIHHVERAGILTDLTGLGTAAVLSDSHQQFFAVTEGRMTTLFKDFDRFIAEVDSRLAGGGRARRLSAVGHFDDATGEMTAVRVTVVIK